MLLSPELRAHIPAAVLHRLTDLLTSSITTTFAWTLLPALAALVLTFGFGRSRWTGFGAPQAAASPAGFDAEAAKHAEAEPGVEG
jgi:hypothetical protein